MDDKEAGFCVLKSADVPRAALTRSCILADVEAEDSGDITLPISYRSFQQWLEYHVDADAGAEQSLQMLQVRCLPLCPGAQATTHTQLQRIQCRRRAFFEMSSVCKK